MAALIYLRGEYVDVEEELLSVVEIKTQEHYYLYPKKRGNIQSLMKLDEVGFHFYQLLKAGKTEEEMKASICHAYQMDEQAQGAEVLKDIRDFKEVFIKNGYLKKKDLKELQTSETINQAMQGFQKQFYEMQTYYIENYKPFRFFIEITYNCNLRCRHCYRGEEVNNRENASIFMDKLKVYSLLDEMEELGVVEVFITGGEPFTHPDIYEILQYASQKNLIITVLTNGNFLSNPKMVHKLEKMQLFDVRISIYGAEEHHDYMTKVKGSHKKSLKALKNINDILGLGTAAYVVTTENYGDCQEVLSYFEGMNTNVSMNVMLTPTAKGNLHPTRMRISPKQYRNMVMKFKLPLSGSRCSAGLSRFRISPNGDVNPCEMIPGHTFGNVYQESLISIMKGEKRKEFNDMFGEMLKNHQCNECSMKKECNFCPALFLQENGDINKPIQYLCDITKEKHEILAEKGLV